MSTWFLVLFAAWMLGGLLCRYAPESQTARRRGRLVALCNMVGSMVLLAATWRHGWEVSLGLWVDSESALLAALASIVSAFLLSASPKRELTRASVGRLLLWTGALQLMFHADSVILMVAAWAASALPFWSAAETPKTKTALRDMAVQLHATSTFPFLVAVAWALLRGESPNVHSLHQTHESGILFLVLFAAMTRLGVAPLHGWLPRLGRVLPAHALALGSPLAGAYLLLRMSQGLSDAFVVDQPWLEALGLTSALYFALVSYGQQEQYRSAQTLGLSQVSLIFVALCATEALAVHGGLVLLVSESLAITGYVGCATLIRSRRGDVDLADFHGLGMKAPYLASLAFVFGVAVVGLPFSLTFVAEDIIAQGLLIPHPLLAMGFVLVTAANAIGMLRHYGRTYLGADREQVRCPDVLGVVRVGLVALALTVLLGGLAPQLSWSAEAHALGDHAPPTHVGEGS